MVARSSGPNNTGRASGKQSGKAKKVMQVTKGEPFVMLTRELVSSPAWQAMSINCRKFIDFLLIEHMNHAGQENGHLLATYGQLNAFGLTHSEISSAIREAEQLGLIRFDPGKLWAGKNQLSTYELTFLPKQQPNPEFPTNDWKRTSEEDVARIRQTKRALRRKKKQKSTSTSRTAQGLKVAPPKPVSKDNNLHKLQGPGTPSSSESRTPSISTLPISANIPGHKACKVQHLKIIN